MKTKMLAGVATLLACAAAAPAVQAATIHYEGSTFVYTDDGGAVDDIIVSIDTDYETQQPMLQIYEYAGTPISAPGDRCKTSGDHFACQIPGAMRVTLGGGHDSFVLQSFANQMPVTMLGGDGNDVLKDDYSLAAGRRFEGGAGDDQIDAYDGNDVLLGEAGNDKLRGGAGSDEVRGGDGDDELEGDKFENPAADVLDGGAGFDVMEEYSIPDRDVHPPATVTQNGAADDGRPGEGDNVTGVEKITSHVNGSYEGTDGADDIWIWSNMAGGESTIRGLGGDDKIKSLDHGETIDGGAGNDTIQAGYGNDVIVGGPGKDNINADGGSYCGLYECKVPFGDDTVDARDGEADQVECGIGNDTVKADAVDQVAPSCENVDRGGSSTSPGPGHGGTTVDPGSIGFALVGKASQRKGVTFKVTCAAACQVGGELVYKRKKVGRGSRTLIAAGTATVRVKLSAKGRKALKRARRARVTLKVTIKDAGGATQTVSRALTLKR